MKKNLTVLVLLVLTFVFSCQVEKQKNSLEVKNDFSCYHEPDCANLSAHKKKVIGKPGNN